MYYILNGTNQIIAADDELLELCAVTHINELYLNIALKKLRFDNISSKNLTIKMSDISHHFSISKTTLSSLIGHLTIVSCAAKIENSVQVSSEVKIPEVIPKKALDIDSILKIAREKTPIQETIEEKAPAPSVEKSHDLDLDMDLNFEAPTKQAPIQETIEEKAPAPIVEESHDLDLDMDLLFETPIQETIEEKAPAPIVEESHDLDLDMDLLFETPIQETIEEKAPAPIVEESHDLDLDMDLLFETPIQETIEEKAPIVEESKPLDIDLIFETPVEVVSETQKVEKVKAPLNNSEILIDVQTVSNQIGISPDDYNSFLNEFIDNAIELEADLNSSDKNKRTEAIDTLSDLSTVLCLKEVSTVLSQIATAEASQTKGLVEILYHTLSRISTAQVIEEAMPIPATEEPIPTVTVEKRVQEIEASTEPIMVETPTVSANSFGEISLEGIRPKHFDFQLEEAANDLSLPVELIEEFVHDFIDQAHIETQKMLACYSKGDLDAIQKIGHLLKGASSNLRINALSDTLYKIQFCERSEDLEYLIKDYWAHFLSFENQINVISS